MNLRLTVGWVLMLGLSLVPVARAEPPTKVQIEVNFLLGYLEGSGCEFYRNGTWHDSKAAQTHLRDKYKYLVARNLINTTEEFIDRAATESSFSGQPYEVRCNGGATVTSNQWLRNELARIRTF
jgi:cobalamin biosynthesis protein CobD/CbiB